MKPNSLKKLLFSEIKSVSNRLAVFDGFTSNLINEKSDILRILAVDGSDVQIATNPDDLSSYYPGTNGQKPYNLLHLNALLDLKHKIYADAVIQGRMDWN